MLLTTIRSGNLLRITFVEPRTILTRYVLAAKALCIREVIAEGKASRLMYEYYMLFVRIAKFTIQFRFYANSALCMISIVLFVIYVKTVGK